jgi:hypothetical protein
VIAWSGAFAKRFVTRKQQSDTAKNIFLQHRKKLDLLISSFLVLIYIGSEKSPILIDDYASTIKFGAQDNLSNV